MPDYRSRQRMRPPADPARRRPQFYGDADVEVATTNQLRSEGFKAWSAHELGHSTKDDAFHAAYARRNGYVLLTRNGKHFWTERVLPFEQCPGLIVITSDAESATSTERIVAFIASRVRPPGSAAWQDTKVRVSSEGARYRVRQ